MASADDDKMLNKGEGGQPFDNQIANKDEEEYPELKEDHYGSEAWVLEFFSGREVVDPCWLGIFLVYLVCYIVTLGYAFGNTPNDMGSMASEGWSTLSDDDMNGLWLGLGVSFAVGLVWFIFLRFCARGAVFLTIFAIYCSLFFWAGLSVYYAWYYSQPSQDDFWAAFGWGCGSAVAISMICMMLCYTKIFWANIKYSIVFTEIALMSVFQRPDSILFTFFMAFVLGAYFIMVIFAINACFAWAWYFMFLVMLMAIYTYLFILAFVRCTLAGSTCSWYFSKGKNYEGCFPILKAMKRSFIAAGALAKGAFIMEVAKVAVWMLKAAQKSLKKAQEAKDGNCFGRCCGLCFMRMVVCWLYGCCCGISHWVQWVTNYAYIEVALEGNDFKSSGKEAMHLLASHGMQAFANDILTHWYSVLISFLGVLLSCVANIFWQLKDNKDGLETPDTINFLPLFLCAWMSYYICRVVTLIVDVGVDSISVCYAYDAKQSETSGFMFAQGDLKKSISEMNEKKKNEDEAKGASV